MSRTREMVSGPIAGQLIAFALPLLGSSLIQQLYNTVDLIFVGHLLGKEASAAVGASSMLATCLVGFFTGMSVGAGVAAARFFGAGEYEKLKDTVHTAVALSLGGGTAAAVLGFVLAPTFLRWMHTPEAVLGQAEGYLRLYFLSLVSIVSYNVGAGILRGLGDSRAPMLYQLVGGLANVAGNAVCIGLLGWGVNGAAAATLLSQSIAAVLVLRGLGRLNGAYRLQWRHARFRGAVARTILQVGVPAGIQAMAITFSNLFIQSRINGLGVDTLAAFTAYFKVELFLYLPILAFGQAVMTFTGQNVGAGRTGRVRQGIRTGLGIGVGFTAASSALLFLFADRAFGLFTSDPDVVAIGLKIARIAYPFYFLYVFLELFASAIRGAGKALPPMLIVLINLCGIRLVLLDAFLAVWPNAEGAVLIYPCTWFATALCMAGYYRFGRWLPAAREQL